MNDEELGALYAARQRIKKSQRKKEAGDLLSSLACVSQANKRLCKGTDNRDPNSSIFMRELRTFISNWQGRIHNDIEGAIAARKSD